MTTTPPTPPPTTRPADEPGTPRPAHPLVRWPARAIAVLVVLPLRALWDAFGASADLVDRFVDRWIARPWNALGRLLLRLLAPAGRLVRPPLSWLARHVARPLMLAFDRLWQRLVLAPTLALWGLLQRLLRRTLLAPLAAALRWVWRASADVLTTVGRAVAAPFVWAWRSAVRPAGRALRRAWLAAWRPVWRPVARASREVRDQVRRALRRD